MLKVLYFSSETKKKFGVYEVINILKKKLQKKIIVKISDNINDIFLYEPNLIHIHGCWRPNLFIVFLIAKLKKIKIIISPHGMLDPFSLSQKKIKKKIAWLLYQKLMFNYSDLIIVNSKLEKKNVKKKIQFKKKIIIIQHGISISESFKINKNNNKDLRFIFFSRIHPSKNLKSLIEIWKENSFFKKYKLDIFGEIAHKKYFLNIKRKIKREKNINYRGVIKGNLQKSLTKYDILIHPSKSENFGLVILEAMSSGLFLILNKKLDWKFLSDKGFAYCINFNKFDLKSKILKIENKKRIIKSKIFRKKLYDFVKKNYNWNRIFKVYLNKYLILNK